MSRELNVNAITGQILEGLRCSIEGRSDHRPLSEYSTF